MFKPAFKSKQCMLCFTRIALRLGAFVGLTPYTVECHHNSNKYGIFYSKFYIIVSAMMILLVAVDCTYTAFTIIKTYATSDTLMIVRHITDLLYSSKGIVVMLHQFISMKLIKKQYEGLLKIIKNPKFFGVDDILDGKIRESLYNYCIMGAWLIICLNIGNAVLIYCITDFSFGYVFMKVIVTLICMYADVVVLYHFTFILIVFRKMFIKRYDSAIQEMSDSYGKVSHIRITASLVQRLHLAALRNFTVWKLQTDPSTLYWNILTMAALVANIYVVLKTILTGNTALLTIRDFCSETRVVSTLFLLFQNMLLIDSLGLVGNDLLSFLYKYPISKLSADDADQVEMLITTLTIQKPVIRASNVFTVGTRMLASISGTIVTYVLVALQFHASWTEES